MEEFHEADVLWPEDGARRRPVSAALPRRLYNSHARESAPLAIPNAASGGNGRPPWNPEFAHRDGDDGSDYGDDDKEMVPPHVLVARRLSRKMAFSVCTGQGRTLKGRDLSQVRNSVLRLTGFLEG